MASRQLRKLRKQQELLNLQNESGHGSDGSEDEPIVTKRRGNPFSGFAALGDEGDGGDDDDEEQQKSEAEDAAPQQAGQEQASGQGEPARKSKKKPKKKKKKGKQTAEASTPAREGGESVDEIDRVLEELRLEAQGSNGPSPDSAMLIAEDEATNALGALLSVNLRHLKAINEMRRLFGKAIDAAEGEERTEDRRRRALPQNMDLETYLSARAAHPGQGPQANKSLFDTVLRTNPFIDGKKTWPRGTAQGLKMIRVSGSETGRSETGRGEVEFAFAHDDNYDALEGNFMILVQAYDPMQIVHFLYRHPYHVSSLIQVSKVARQDQNSALAADLIERALFTFGRVSLSEFRKKLEKGLVRMDFRRPENRQFFLAGYNYIQRLIMKGTYRTALEWAKLFLSLDHADPYAMRNWIHVLAIRAHEAQWFIDFCNLDFYKDFPSVSLFSTYIKQTLPLAYLQLKDTEKAKSTLIKGMERMPWLYCSLFSALNVDTPKSVWGIQPRDEDELLHTELYIHMTKDLWNTPQTISLLKDAAASVTRVADPSTLPLSPRVDLAIARFIYLDNTPALMSLVPRGMLHASPNFDFDPLPPSKEQNIFSSVTQELPWVEVEQRNAETTTTMRRARTEAERQQVLAEARAFADQWLRVQGEPGLDPLSDSDEEDGGEEREGGAPPGVLDYLRHLLGRPGQEIADDVEEPGGSQAHTGMPGGWGEGEGWEEDEVDDYWGQDDFEGVDDFEGGGGDDDEGDEHRAEAPERG
ncbi:ribosome quality control complex subunit 1 [Achaetomium macrosporum]|uniref:Ribosome quality control complex subunit 1 n=1 Tax=Achaetomium macrosporum TaxID=79813 RepID=A0AAN7HA38_9PEZI|nr:ribosome quality control complex subunit 1 [Achaetomium macrosporum]